MICGISEKLDIDSLAYVNAGADATHLRGCLQSQLGDQKYVLIQVGTNNLEQELRSSLPAMGGLLDSALKSCDSQILVNAVPGHLHDEKKNDLAVRINTFLKHKCNKTPRLQYVNCNPALESNFYAVDGLHFNELGKKSYANHLKNFLTLISNFANQPLAKQM